MGEMGRLRMFQPIAWRKGEDMTSDEYESAVDGADHRRQEIKELMSEISNSRCGKCGSLLAHYRLHGLRCTNLSCPGPFNNNFFTNDITPIATPITVTTVSTDEHGNPIPGPLELADMLVRIKKIEQWIEQQRR